MRQRRRATVAWCAALAVAATVWAPAQSPAAADEDVLLPTDGSDTFDGSTLDSQRWERVRPEDDAIEVGDGMLTISTLPGDLYTGTNTAQNLVLQEAPLFGRWRSEERR